MPTNNPIALLFFSQKFDEFIAHVNDKIRFNDGSPNCRYSQGVYQGSPFSGSLNYRSSPGGKDGSVSFNNKTYQVPDGYIAPRSAEEVFLKIVADANLDFLAQGDTRGIRYYQDDQQNLYICLSDEKYSLWAIKGSSGEHLEDLAGTRLPFPSPRLQALDPLSIGLERRDFINRLTKDYEPVQRDAWVLESKDSQAKGRYTVVVGTHVYSMSEDADSPEGISKHKGDLSQDRSILMLPYGRHNVSLLLGDKIPQGIRNQIESLQDLNQGPRP